MFFDNNTESRNNPRLREFWAEVDADRARHVRERLTAYRRAELARESAWNLQRQPVREDPLEAERRGKAVEKIRLANPNTNPIGLGTSFERLIPPTDPAFRDSRPRISLKESFKELWK